MLFMDPIELTQTPTDEIGREVELLAQELYRIRITMPGQFHEDHPHIDWNLGPDQ
jgi:hypothetical protein